MPFAPAAYKLGVDMQYVAGVDLGTTFTAAAVSRGVDGRPEIFPLGTRAASVPSVVLVRDDGDVLVGDAAARRAALEPDRVGREFKRRLGDPTPLLLGGAPHSAESLQAKLLRSVVDAIAQQEGGPPDRLVITHPANWGPFKRELLTQTLHMAGLDHAVTITEPEAAAIHYASQERIEPGEVVAVYDLGGGTFDAAVLRKTASDTGFEILGTPEGLEHLGGLDIDHAVLQHVNAALGGALGDLDLDDPAARAELARLRAECTAAKEALSADTEVVIPASLGGKRTEVRLTRAELDEMVRSAIGETVDALRRAIASAGIETDNLGRILLVGGGSRMPIVSRMVASEFGRPVALDAHPKHAIALGAALVAAQDEAAQAAVAAAVPQSPSLDATDDAASVSAPPPVSSRRARKERQPAAGRSVRGALVGVVAATLGLAVIAYALFIRPQAEAAEVLYQDPVSSGPSPFTAPAVANVSPSTLPPTSESPAAPHGPFGGSGEVTTCDKQLLAGFLKSNPERLNAWAGVLGVPAEDLDAYMESLREATLTVDTRVTNHGFRNGEVFALQSILASGTAVLVDQRDRIVTRCYCGNPLTPPVALGATSCTGCPAGYVPPVQCEGARCFRFVGSTHAEATPTPEAGNGRAGTLGGGGGTVPAETDAPGRTITPVSEDQDSEPDPDKQFAIETQPPDAPTPFQITPAPTQPPQFTISPGKQIGN